MQRIRDGEGAKLKFVYRQRGSWGVQGAPRNFWAPEGRRRDGISALGEKNASNVAV